VCLSSVHIEFDGNNSSDQQLLMYIIKTVVTKGRIARSVTEADRCSKIKATKTVELYLKGWDF